jgi:hypothetical protein
MLINFLLPHHLAQLTQESGLNDATIMARGYRSITKKAELSDLGFTRIQQHVPALLCPVWNVAGEIGNYQLRPDAPRIHRRRGKPIKYETPSDSRMLIDVPPAARPFLGDPQRPLWATEGFYTLDWNRSPWERSQPASRGPLHCAESGLGRI